MITAIEKAVAGETDRSTGTVGRLRRRVDAILAETAQAGDRRAMPPERTFYRLAGHAWPRAGTPSARPAPAGRWPSSRTGRSAR